MSVTNIVPADTLEFFRLKRGLLEASLSLDWPFSALRESVSGATAHHRASSETTIRDVDGAFPSRPEWKTRKGSPTELRRLRSSKTPREPVSSTTNAFPSSPNTQPSTRPIHRAREPRNSSSRIEQART